MVELKCYNISNVSNVQQSDSVIYVSILFQNFSHLGYYRILSSDSKESACNSGDTGSVSGLERSSGEGNGNPLQYSCLENPMDRGATVQGVAKSRTQLDN